eukprot:14283566-Heterocapsa_arctica.AAC.1
MVSTKKHTVSQTRAGCKHIATMNRMGKGLNYFGSKAQEMMYSCLYLMNGSASENSTALAD